MAKSTFSPGVSMKSSCSGGAGMTILIVILVIVGLAGAAIGALFFLK